MSQRLRRERATPQQKSKWRLAGYVVAGILGTMLTLGVMGLLLILRTAPPPVIHTDPAAARRFAEELQRAETAAAAGSPGVVRADETELNSTLEEYLRAAAGVSTGTGDAKVRDMRLGLFADRMRLYVLTSVRGRDITIVFETKVHTSNGYLEFEPLSGKIGALPIPKASLRSAVERMAATPENRKFMRLPSNLRDLRVEDGKIVVTYK
jgi:hypothetical protein